MVCRDGNEIIPSKHGTVDFGVYGTIGISYGYSSVEMTKSITATCILDNDNTMGDIHPNLYLNDVTPQQQIPHDHDEIQNEWIVVVVISAIWWVRNTNQI